MSSDNNTKRVAIYSRVSTQKQLDRTDYDSMQSHLDRCKHYILAQENWELVKIYEDPAESGDKWERDKLQEMLFDVRQDNIDVLVTFKLDRVSRIVRQFHEILTILDNNDADLVSVTQGFDTSTPAGKLLRNILIDFAQFERDMISERVKEKRLARAKKGLWNGGGIPFGYKSDDRKLVVAPEEAKIVKTMFDVYSETRSRTRVREQLELMGAKTRKGKNFSKSTVEVILSNPVYAGKIVENGDLFDGIHEAIIDEETFFSLNKVEPAREHGRISKTDKVYLLKGLVKCGKHKCKMTPYWVKKNDKQIYYYQCTKYAHYKKLKCPIKNINAEKLENYVVDRLRDMSKSEDDFYLLVDQVNLDLETKKKPVKKEYAELGQKIKDMEAQLEKYIDAVGESSRKTVTELFEKRVEKLQRQIKELEKKKSDLALMMTSSPSEINAREVLETLKDFSGIYDEFSNQEKATYLSLIVQDVTVLEDRVNIRIHTLPEKPSVLTGSKNRLVWLPSTDSNRGPSG